MNILPIEKDLKWENEITAYVKYIPIAGPSSISNFRSPDSYVFIFFEKAKGIHTIDFTNHNEEDRQVHISFPGQLRSWETEISLGHKLIISKPFMEKNLLETIFSRHQINITPVINLTMEQNEMLHNEFMLLKQYFQKVDYSELLINLRIQLIINLINNIVINNAGEQENNAKIHPIVLNLNTLIEENLEEKRSVHFYAKQLAVTPNYLNVLVKRTTGQTAKKHIDSRIVLEAKRRILGTSDSIKTVALDLGFSSAAFFSSFIFKQTGFHPNQIRNKKPKS